MIHKRITKHKFDAKNTKSIPVDRHFLLPGHNFDRHFKLTIIEEITNQNMTQLSFLLKNASIDLLDIKLHKNCYALPR